MAKNNIYQEKICDYEDTVFAILGFMNLYRFDDKDRTMRKDIKVFQGRRLIALKQKIVADGDNKTESFDKIEITPDIGIIYSENAGVIAEVKKSFCRNQEHWIDDFEQLMAYDYPIEDWPTNNGKLDHHEIALIVHQSRARIVTDFYEQNKGDKIKFERQFSIIEFNRSDEASPFLFFRTFSGALLEKELNARLRVGISVPMEKLSDAYSEIKLYDAQPPCPYLLGLIWTNIIIPIAIQDNRFLQIRKNGNFEIVVEIDHVIDVLHNTFSFKKLHSDDRKQPRIPYRKWIVEAFDILVKAGEAKWIDKENGKLSVIFRKYGDIIEHFIELCLNYCKDAEEVAQIDLFDQVQDNNQVTVPL